MAEASQNYCDIHCAEVYVPRTALARAMWTLLGIALTILGSAVTYAIATTKDIAVLKSEVVQNTSDIADAKARYDMIDSKLDAIFAGVQENKSMLRGKQVTQ